MWLRTMLAGFLIAAAVVLAATVPLAGQSGTAKGETVTIFFPKGDPGAGRIAFRVLKCTACHRVHGEKDMPTPVSADPGPLLGPDQAAMDPGRLISSIITPSHMIVEEAGKRREGKLSAMGDFDEYMRVRHLIDLVAYLRSLGEER